MYTISSKNSISPRKMMLVLTLLALIFFFSMTIQSARAAGVIFVDTDATGANDGSSWADAYPDLQAALTTAVSGDEIWIAEGVYYPSDNDQNATFQVVDGVSIYGGFVGSETDSDQADWDTYKTVLSGDIDQNDTVTASGIVTSPANTNSNNTLSPIVSIAAASTGIHIEGITITAGKGTGLNSDGSTLTMTNVAFWGNVGTNGGGMYSAGTTAVLTNVHFYANKANTGGGLRTHSGGTMQIIGGVFKGNETTGDGGGFYNRSATAQVYNAVFSGNKGSLGAAFYNRNAQATLTNSTVSGNLAIDETNGAAIHNRGNTAVVDIQNSIVWNNGTDAGGIGLGSALGDPNTINTTYSLIQDDTITGVGNLDSLDADNMPHFAEPVFPLDAPTTSGDLRLPADAPTVDAGENSFISGITADLLGDNRIQNGIVNMGAYETAEITTTACGLIYVDHAATGNDDGTSWGDAYPTVQDAIQIANSHDRCEIWVAGGTYYPDQGVGQIDNDTSATFSIQDGISLYGGFAGNESQRSQRDWEGNPTSLSGDIEQNDGAQISGNNTATLITTQRANYIVDGFTLTASTGDAVDSDESVLFLGNSRLEGIKGRGVYGLHSSLIIDNFVSTQNEGTAVYALFANLLLLDSLFTQNEARSVYVYGGNLAVIRRMTFVENSTTCLSHVETRHLAKFVQMEAVDFRQNDVLDDDCGRTAVFQSHDTKIEITNSLFANNTATAFSALSGGSKDIALNNVSFINNISKNQGGGARLDLTYYDDVSLTNILFAGNQSVEEGGGLYLFNPNNVQLTNIAFNKNHAEGVGGGIYIEDNDADVDAILTNVTIANNQDNQHSDRGAGITLVGDNNITLQNSVIWNNYTYGFNDMTHISTIEGGAWSATYSLIQEKNPAGAGNLAGDTDPLFISELDVRLQQTSPLRNVGNSSAAFFDEKGNATDISAIPYDLAGVKRTQGSDIDLGAYESFSEPDSSHVVYVDKDAGGANNGTSWTNAYLSLSDALSNSDAVLRHEIWVAEGEYIPTNGTSFELMSGVAVFGGFDGTETDRADRDWVGHLTVLSGDLDQNDSKTNGVVTDIDDINGVNSAVVISATAVLTQSTQLDGFTITAGEIGIHNEANDHLLLENVTIQGNRLHGMANVDSAPKLVNVQVLDNGRSLSGGGLYNDHASPMLVNVLVARNEATQGAGIYNSNQSRPRLINLTIVDNIASDVAGGMYMTGGSVGTMENSLAWGNEDASGVGTETAVIATSNLANNHLAISYSLLQGQYPAGTGNLDGNNAQFTPQFISATDYRMAENSPTINEGENDVVNYVGYGSGSSAITDLDQNTRIQWNVVDLGSYETVLTQCGNPTPIYVNHAATGKNDGSSWVDAYTTLQDALQYGAAHCEVWVAQGSYYPDDGGINPKQGLSTATFAIPAGMALYGGFDGSELSRTERHWQENETILDGAVTIHGHDAYHVVSIIDGVDVQLDGFTVQGGTAKYIKEDETHAYGGGVYLSDSSAITLTHMTIINNRAAMGGGVGNDNSQVTIINSEISDNTAYNNNYNLGYVFPIYGGYFEMGYGEIKGGGIYNDGTMLLLNSTIAYNSAPQEVYDTWNDDHCSGVVVIGYQDPVTGRTCDCETVIHGTGTETDCWTDDIFLEAGQGGGVSNAGDMDIQNSIIWGNTTNDKYPGHDEFFDDYGSTMNSASSKVGGDSPQFISDSNLRLKSTSPVIDMGNNTLYTDVVGNLDTDLAHNPRIINDTIDMGAYESQQICEVTAGSSYTFGDVEITIEPGGAGNVDCLTVYPYARSHSQATPGIQTDIYWHIEALASNGSPASGYATTLTIKTSFIPDSSDKLCRYADGGWDCAADSFDAGQQTITRNGVTAFSDWAVGNDVGPTAVSLQSVTTQSRRNGRLVSISMLFSLTIIVLYRRRKTQHNIVMRR